MPNTRSEDEFHQFTYKNEHLLSKLVESEVPDDSVLITVLRPFEERLRLKNLIEDSSGISFPFWFLAETERNLFLWKNSLSLADAKFFEFWLDPESLFKKRQYQLSQFSEENIFSDSHLASSGLAPNSRECFYLEELSTIFAKSSAHLIGISKMVSGLNRMRHPNLLPVFLSPNRCKDTNQDE